MAKGSLSITAKVIWLHHDFLSTRFSEFLGDDHDGKCGYE